MIKQFRIDLKNRVEEVAGAKVFPVTIPDKSVYPCIQLVLTGGLRNTDSTMKLNNVKDYRLSLTVCSPTLSVCYDIEELLIEAIDNEHHFTVGTKTLIAHHDNSVELFNYQQSLYELTVDFMIKRLI